MDCPENTKGRTKAAQCVQAVIPLGELQGVPGGVSQAFSSWGKEKASSQDLFTSPWGKNQLYNLIPLPVSASPGYAAPLGASCMAAPWSIKSTGCSSQGQFALLGVCWVPNAADGMAAPLGEAAALPAGAMGQGTDVALEVPGLRVAHPWVMETWLSGYPVDAQGLGPLGAAMSHALVSQKSFHNVLWLHIRPRILLC